MLSFYYGRLGCERYLEYVKKKNTLVRTTLGRWEQFEQTDDLFWNRFSERLEHHHRTHPHEQHVNLSTLRDVGSFFLHLQRIQQDPKTLKLLKSLHDCTEYEAFCRSFGHIQRHIQPQHLPLLAQELVMDRLRKMVDVQKQCSVHARRFYSTLLPSWKDSKTFCPQQIDTLFEQRMDPNFAQGALHQSYLSMLYSHVDLTQRAPPPSYQYDFWARKYVNGFKILQKCLPYAAQTEGFFHAQILSYCGYCNSADFLRLCLNAQLQIDQPLFFSQYSDSLFRHPLLHSSEQLPAHHNICDHFEFFRMFLSLQQCDPHLLSKPLHLNYAAASGTKATHLTQLLIESKRTNPTASYWLMRNALNTPTLDHKALLQTLDEHYTTVPPKEPFLHSYVQQQRLELQVDSPSDSFKTSDSHNPTVPRRRTL